MTGAPGAKLTMTDTGAEVTVSDALSVTWSSKDQVPVVVKAPVETEGLEPEVQLNKLPKSLKLPAAGASWSHWQV
jgi:hypothetical protein